MKARAKQPLTFDALRRANLMRLPLFKNKHGQLAHAKGDGSDWSPAQWLQAVLGELGEYANLRKKFERGDIGREEFQLEAGKELADVQIYLDILAFRLGIDLGEATMSKWNEVSRRVAVPLELTPEGPIPAPQWATKRTASPRGPRVRRS
jgi:NTP pyrophosphatase (non-canonical NTP hydrolase)